MNCKPKSKFSVPRGLVSKTERISGLVLAILACWMTVFCPTPVRAGLGPENVMVIVNENDPDSLTIANHYVSIRNIPDRNVMTLSDVPAGLTISLEDFREKILRPVLSEINDRKLAPHIRCVAYSAGFPTGVKINSHTQQLTDPNAKKYQTPVASLNSLTFFYQFILADSYEYLGWTSNLYARGTFERHFQSPMSGEVDQAFQAADEAMDEERFAEAGEAYAKLAEQFPRMSPLHIRASEAFWRSENRLKAIEHLGLAVKAGWANRRYLLEDSPLAELLEGKTAAGSDSLSKLLAALQDVPPTAQYPLGFAADIGWTSNGHPTATGSGGVNFMLSTMLAVVHPNGSTLDQAIDVFERGVRSDRTFPKAAVGFAKTGDVRSKTRFPALTDALTWLLARDREVDIFSSRLPSKAKDYVGLILGTASFDILGRQWNLVPGAIADNLTSTGAVFRSRGQTKLTELLRAGAVMSSGAVNEPYSIPMKFPSPMMHPFYYEGVTAIEAFYLSTFSPYQLLIVGDPLAQPFAKAPADAIAMTMDEQTVDDQRVIRFTRRTNFAQPPDPSRNTPAAMMEIYLQDRLVQRVPPLQEVKLQVPAKMVGPLDCRAVLVGDHPTRPRIGFEQTFVLGPREKLPQIRKLASLSDETSCTLQCECVGAESLELKQFGRVIATVDSLRGTVKLSRRDVGDGPLRLQLIGKKGDRTLVGPMTVIDDD